MNPLIQLLVSKIVAIVTARDEAVVALRDRVSSLEAALEEANARILAIQAEDATEDEALLATLQGLVDTIEPVVVANPTPLADEIISLVVDEPAIPTPDSIDQVPSVGTEVATESSVLEAAVEAILSVEPTLSEAVQDDVPV
jgi:hypothetical protein